MKHYVRLLALILAFSVVAMPMYGAADTSGSTRLWVPSRLLVPLDVGALKARAVRASIPAPGITHSRLRAQSQPIWTADFFKARRMASFSASSKVFDGYTTGLANRSALTAKTSRELLQSSSHRAIPMTVNSNVTATAGSEPWWNFNGGMIPGVGKYAVNVVSGNLLVAAADMSISHKGVAFAFARAYNSTSQHDYTNTDGSVPSNYGNGWTNTWDIHLARNSSGGLSVYDATGARHDFTGSDTAGYTGGAGEDSAIRYIAQYDAYDWAQKNGSVFVFYDPTQPSSSAALAGRLGQIYGRNENNYLSFTYAFDNGNASSSSNLNKITVSAEDGESASLSFANFGSYRLLSTLTWVNGTTVAYKYDSSANLIEVDEPGNSAASTIAQGYTYVTNTYQMQQAISPRYYAAGTDGAYVKFAYTGVRVVGVSYIGFINPSISDGTTTGYVQPNMPAGNQDWQDITLSYNSPTNATTVTDSDGHEIIFKWDTSNNRVVEADAVAGSTTLSRKQTWDADNNRISLTDERGNTSNAAYDSMRNPVAIAGPPTTLAGGSTVKPTQLISYDSNFNPVAICDATWSASNSKSWSGTGPGGSDSLCPDQSGVSRFSWTTTTSDPIGELTTATTPLGYQRTVAYSASSQGGTDYGQPTSVTGQAISQADGTSRTPLVSVQYDSHGNTVCGNLGMGWSVAQYDSANRITAIGDADDKSLSGCGKTNGTMTTASYAGYYANGQLEEIQSPAQRAASLGTTFQYDRDKNLIASTRHFGGIAGTKSLFYDAADRPVEVVEPADSSNFYSYPFMRRYLYDLSKGGTIAIGGNTALKAFGNQFATQEYLSGPSQTSSGSSGTASWMTVGGSTRDGFNRRVSQYDLTMNSTKPIRTNVYDASAAALGRLSSSTDDLGVETTRVVYSSGASASWVIGS